MSRANDDALKNEIRQAKRCRSRRPELEAAALSLSEEEVFSCRTGALVRRVPDWGFSLRISGNIGEAPEGGNFSQGGTRRCSVSLSPGTRVGPPTSGVTPRMRQRAVSTLPGTEGTCRRGNAHQGTEPFLCAPGHVGKVRGPSAELLIALDFTRVSARPPHHDTSDCAVRALQAPGVSSLYHLAPSTQSHILLCLVARWRNVIMGFSNNLSTALKELSCSPDSEL